MTGTRGMVHAGLVSRSSIQREPVRRLAHGRPGEATAAGEDGQWHGEAFLYIAGVTATDDVVFAEPRDLILLGARSLEGLNLRVDSRAKQLVDAGPAPAAVAE